MSGSKDTAGSLAEAIAQGVARLIDEAVVAAKIETIHDGYGAGWQCANHAWRIWLDKNIPDWDAMKGVDLTTVPRMLE